MHTVHHSTLNNPDPIRWREQARGRIAQERSDVSPVNQRVRNQMTIVYKPYCSDFKFLNVDCLFEIQINYRFYFVSLVF